MFEGSRRSTVKVHDRSRQQDVVHWFDATYREMGERYLRPSQAYEIFPALLRAQAGPLAGKRLLDVACGPGLLLHQAIGQGLEVSGIDISSVAIEAARGSLDGVTLEVASAECLPFADAGFDFVTCIGSLERFLAADRALGEMRRVMKPGGTLLVMVRNSRTLSWQLLRRLGLSNVAGHQGADDDRAWQQRLESAGFSIEAVYPDQWPLMWRQRLLRRLGGRGDFITPRAGLLPLAFANELIYLCSPQPN